MTHENEMKKLTKRYNKEKKYSNASAQKKGELDGKQDAMDFHYHDFNQLHDTIVENENKKYSITSPQKYFELIKKLYDDSNTKRHERNKKFLSIKIDDGNQEKEYKIVTNKVNKRRAISFIKMSDEYEYYKGWFKGVKIIWNKIDPLS